MNETTPTTGDLGYLKGLARRLQANPQYMAWALHEYGHQERLGEDELAGALQLDAAMLTRLSLCKRPDSSSPAFADQVREISEYVGVDAGTLAGLLRQVDSLSALAGLPHSAQEAETTRLAFAWRRGLLAAARDRTDDEAAEEPTEEENPDQQDLGAPIAPDQTDQPE